MLAQRAAREHQAAESLLHVKHHILGPIPPAAEHVRAAMRDPELRHRVLHLVRLLSTTPLVIAECVEHEDGDDDGEGGDDVEDDGASAPVSRSPVQVVMHRPRYERVCGSTGGQRFVVFAPWHEQSAARSANGVRIIFAPFAEALA